VLFLEMPPAVGLHGELCIAYGTHKAILYALLPDHIVLDA
jgi:hypothetical protein